MLIEYGLQAAQSVLTFLAVAVVWLLVKLFTRYVDEKKRDLIAEIITDGVRFVQERFGNWPGERRYREALAWIRAELEKRKIRLTEEQLEALIHSILKALKLEYGDSWWQVPQRNTPEEKEAV